MNFASPEATAAEIGIAALIAAAAVCHIEVASGRNQRRHLYAFGVVLVSLGLYYNPIWEQSYEFTAAAFQLDAASNTRLWYLLSSSLLLLGLGALYLVKRGRR